MKSKYDSSRHVLVEQMEMEKPAMFDEYCDAVRRKAFKINLTEKEKKDIQEFLLQLRSLRTIPCSPDFKGVHDRIYEEHLDYKVNEYSDENRIHQIEAVPVNTDDEDIYDAVRRKRNQSKVEPPTGDEDLWKEKCRDAYELGLMTEAGKTVPAFDQWWDSFDKSDSLLKEFYSEATKSSANKPELFTKEQVIELLADYGSDYGEELTPDHFLAATTFLEEQTAKTKKRYGT